MKGFVIRSRCDGCYLDRRGGFDPDPAAANVFPAREDAEAHLVKRVTFPGSCEVLGRADDGTEAPSPDGVPGGRSPLLPPPEAR
jgi:hypothetical protein